MVLRTFVNPRQLVIHWNHFRWSTFSNTRPKYWPKLHPRDYLHQYETVIIFGCRLSKQYAPTELMYRLQYTPTCSLLLPPPKSNEPTNPPIQFILRMQGSIHSQESRRYQTNFPTCKMGWIGTFLPLLNPTCQGSNYSEQRSDFHILANDRSLQTSPQSVPKSFDWDRCGSLLYLFIKLPLLRLSRGFLRGLLK